jgi:hypothetical protein
MSGSSVVHPLGKLDREMWSSLRWQDIPYPAYEAERFLLGGLTAIVFEVFVLGTGILVWKLI